MATHSSVLAWRILWTEEPGGLQSMGSQELATTERLGAHTVTPSVKDCYFFLFFSGAGGNACVKTQWPWRA